MNKKRIIAVGISLIGLFLMGYSAGVMDKTGTTNHSLFWIGLAIVSVGVFIVFPYRKDKKP